jgi:hypothetical protein
VILSWQGRKESVIWITALMCNVLQTSQKHSGHVPKPSANLNPALHKVLEERRKLVEQRQYDAMVADVTVKVWS